MTVYIQSFLSMSNRLGKEQNWYIVVDEHERLETAEMPYAEKNSEEKGKMTGKAIRDTSDSRRAIADAR